MPPLENVQSALLAHGSKNTGGDDWRCPAHDDTSASLTVQSGDNVDVVMRCGAGCDTAKVLAKIGLTMADLHADSMGNPVDTEHYVYTDPEKRPLFRVTREQYERGKKFHQSHPVNGSWQKGLNGVNLVLFQLPRVKRAARKGKTIHIVEGEKDVLRLKEAKIVATTKPGGAGSRWLAAYTDALRGAGQLVIWADRDAPGYTGARATYRALSAAGLAVRLVLPVPDHAHADATDHLDAGHTVDDAKEVTPDELDVLLSESTAAAEDERFRKEYDRQSTQQAVRVRLRQEEADAAFIAPTSDPSLKESLAKPRPPLPYTIDLLHPTGSSALIAASYKVGKTMLMMNLARSYADGSRFLGYFDVSPGPGRIAYWNFELPEDMFLDYIKPLEIENPDRVVPLHLRGQAFDLRSPAAFRWAVGWLRDNGVDALIADPLANFARLTNENDNAEAARWLSDHADRLKAEAGIRDLWIPAHTGRGEVGEGDEHVRGASAVDGWADVRWTYTKQALTRENGQVTYPRYLIAHGRRVELGEHEVEFDPNTSDLFITERRSRAAARRDIGALAALKAAHEEPGAGVRQLQGVMSGDTNGKPAAIQTAVRKGWLRIEEKGNKKQHYATEEGRVMLGLRRDVTEDGNS